MVIKEVNSHEYIAIDLTSFMVIIFEIASDHPPPTLSTRTMLLFIFTIYRAKSIAKNNKIEEEKANNSRPKFVKDSDSLTEISDPKMAPKDPPAIINPYNFLDFISLNILITNTQNIETTKKE